ncbi:MAG: preprotein translocase subunit SecE [Patescibacteria group bacterium]
MSLSGYLRETLVELKQVSWPTRREAATFTLLVIGFSIIVAALLGLFDFLFLNLLELVV